MSFLVSERNLKRRREMELITFMELFITKTKLEKNFRLIARQLRSLTRKMICMRSTSQAHCPIKPRHKPIPVGAFLISPAPPGRVNLHALAYGEKIGSVSLRVRAREDTNGTTYSFNFISIYADMTGDPTPDCVEQ